MSWSVNLIGTPDNISKSLEKTSTELAGKSKEEFDAALPHMIGLVKQNYNASNPNLALNLIASGHGYDGYNSCFVRIEAMSANLC